MNSNNPDGRSPLAVAVHWASQVTTVSVQMVLPILLGVWVDRSWGTKAVFTILGAAAGLWLGIWNLIRIARALADGDVLGKQGNDRDIGKKN
jgi:hypothetical protein